ncbi:MAG: YIP1 family protein [Melioribacteraceae bacterium]
MKNVLICNNCGRENDYYKLNCTECKSFLRARIVNIDFWDTVWKFFYSPVHTAQKIIQAENKNYLITSSILTAFKISLVSLILMNAFGNEEGGDEPFSRGILLGGMPFLLITSLFSFLVTLLNKKFGISGRFKDNLSIYLFSFIPLNMALLILTPIQFALFGEYWFTFNPSPFIMKPQASVVILILEIVMLIWSAVLFVTSTYAQTKNRAYSIAAGLAGFAMIIGVVAALSIWFN